MYTEIENGYEAQHNFHKRTKIYVEIEWTPRYSWYLPTIELNLAVKEFAINIFCLGIYICWHNN
jgi:hypothetical protein